MSKLAKTSAAVTAGGIAALRTTSTPDITTYEGAPGYSRDAKTELFTLAVANFVSEQTSYESAQDRDTRFRELIARVTVEDPEWVADFLSWLRQSANMRSAAIVGAVEYGRAVQPPYPIAKRKPGTLQVTLTPRAVLNSVISRADEPGEALGYWLGRYGRPLPKWLKKSLGDSALRLYTPFNSFKYDGQSQRVRFADVIEFSQIEGDNPVWKWLLDRRHGHAEGDYGIEMLRARQDLEALPVPERLALITSTAVTGRLRAAGMTWESVSGWLQGPMDAAVWEALVPLMGYMALLRNLRNFDEAGVSDEVAQKVLERLTDPEQVATSRQLPFRFYSAYQAAPSDRWKHGLGKALDLSLHNVPNLDGRTLVLIDVSGSMSYSPLTARSSVYPWAQAALFGLALARSQAKAADVVAFDTSVRSFKLNKGANTLAELARFRGLVTGGGTYTAQAVRQTFDPNRHDRVVVLSDQQAHYDGVGVFDSVSHHVPCYTFDVVGYHAAHAPTSSTRHLVAGLTDSAFQMMKSLESAATGRWPWQTE
jgi:hypothetical protein